MFLKIHRVPSRTIYLFFVCTILLSWNAFVMAKNPSNSLYRRRTRTDTTTLEDPFERDYEASLFFQYEDTDFFRFLEMSMSMSMSMSYSYSYSYSSPTTPTTKRSSAPSPPLTPTLAPTLTVSALPSTTPSVTPTTTPTADVTNVPSALPSSAHPSSYPFSLMTASPSMEASKSPSNAPVLLETRECPGWNETEDGMEVQVLFQYAVETTRNVDLRLELEQGLLDVVADAMLDCEGEGRRLQVDGLLRLDSRPEDVVSTTDSCVPSVETHTCTVIDAGMTLTTSSNSTTLQDATLAHVESAMQTDLLTHPDLVQLRYLGPILETSPMEVTRNETLVNPLQTVEESPKLSKQPILYSLVGVLPLVLGLLGVYTLRRKTHLVPQRKGYLYHSEPRDLEGTNSEHSCESEGEFVNVELDPVGPPPELDMLSPAITVQRKNTGGDKPRMEI